MRVAVRAAALAALLAAGGTGCKSCDDKGGASGSGEKNDATAGDARAGASASADAAPREMVQALPGCHVTIAGGHASKLAAPASLSLAASSGRALLTSTTLDRALARATGDVEIRARSERMLLGATGTPESPPQAIAAGVPGDVSTLAAAVVFGGELTTLTYAARALGLPRPSPPDCDGVLAATTATSAAGGPNRRELVGHACRPPGMFRAAARGKLGIALAMGPSPTVEAWLLEGAETRPATIEALVTVAGDAGAGRGVIDAPAVGAGAATFAAAYVVDRGGTTRELHVSRVARRGEAPTKVEVIDKQHVGTVSLAFENDTLHVVWSSFVPEKNRWVLRWSKWPAGGTPTPPQSIGTGVVSATMPSLAIDRGHFLLAWAEGDENATVVRVGASKQSLAAISGLSTVASNAGTVARDPVVALDGDSMFVAWTERDRPGAAASDAGGDARESAVVRTSALKCLE